MPAPRLRDRDMVKIPEFVQRGQLTPEGQALIEWIEKQIAYALDLLESKRDVNFYNGMAGPLKHYDIHVQRLRAYGPDSNYARVTWLKEFAYGASVMYENMLIEREAAEAEKRNSETAAKTGDLESKLAKMQEDLAAVIAENKRLSEAAKVTVTVETAGDETPEVVQKHKAGKGRKSEVEGSETPAETAAEEPEKPAEA